MSNQYELTGTVSHIGETQTFASGFTKREFVVTTDEKYPQDVKFEVTKDKCNEINFKVTDSITVSFNVRGNEHNGRYFVNLQAWKWEVDNSSNYEAALDQERERVESSKPRGVAASKVASIDDIEEEVPF